MTSHHESHDITIKTLTKCTEGYNNILQGRSYVEAEEAVASSVFVGLMNIMIKLY